MPDERFRKEWTRKEIKAMLDDWKTRVKRIDAAEAYLAMGGFVLEDGPFDAATFEWFYAIADGSAKAADPRWKAPPRSKKWLSIVRNLATK